MQAKIKMNSCKSPDPKAEHDLQEYYIRFLDLIRKTVFYFTMNESCWIYNNAL